MLNTKLAPWPVFSFDEIVEVARVLDSGKVNYHTGDEIKKFEKKFARWVGTSEALGLFNGTVALDVALKALGIGPGGEVIVTPRTFIASVSCVANAGATPVFADVDRDSGNLSAATIEPMITDKTRAVIVVHLAGWPCDMNGIMALADKHGFAVIEDCAQAHGARYRGQSVGAIGRIGAWSFCQDKIMTTGGEGGMITTDDKELWSRMWSFKDHGKSWERYNERHDHRLFRYVHEDFGTNWRMLEIQAAIGLVQLKRMRRWTAARTRNARALIKVMRRHPGVIRVPEPDPRDTHAYYRLYAYVRPEGLKDGWSRDRILGELAKAKVPSGQGTCPEVYLEKAFDDTDWRPEGGLPVARELGETSLMFLTHPTLTDRDLEFVGTRLDRILRKATA